MTNLNIMNFVRASEPRLEMDLFGCLKKQLECMKRYGLRSTLLLQYDALIDREYRDLIAEYSDMLDVGVWLEIVRPLCEKAGVKYHGRNGWDWDYHSNAAFLIGYEPQERYALIDVVFSDFKKFFGRYPSVAGCWVLDALSLRYMKEKYPVVCAMNCVEQWGIDGYTLWGGYPAGGYFPSVDNAFSPANDPSGQIDLPVFRFTGQDTTHYYGGTNVYTLEPAALDAGGNEKWTSWYYEQVLSSPSLAFSYLQTGQENSFGWDRLGKGFEMQCRMISEMQRAEKIRLQTMKETGEEFSERFSVTPATARCMFRDWSEEGKQSVWYMSRFYRSCVIADEKGVRFRDIFKFDQNFRERYLDTREKSATCFYSNPEVFSGLKRKDGREAAIFFEDGSGPHRAVLSGREVSENTLEITSSDGYRIVFEEERIRISVVDGRAFRLDCVLRDPPGSLAEGTDGLFDPPSVIPGEDGVGFGIERDGKTFVYDVGVCGGRTSRTADGFSIVPEPGREIVLALSRKGRYL